jgi:hypothetical protein
MATITVVCWDTPVSFLKTPYSFMYRKLLHLSSRFRDKNATAKLMATTNPFPQHERNLFYHPHARDDTYRETFMYECGIDSPTLFAFTLLVALFTWYSIAEPHRFSCQ